MRVQRMSWPWRRKSAALECGVNPTRRSANDAAMMSIVDAGPRRRMRSMNWASVCSLMQPSCD
jgi:hypothetical protein